ncbi:hypothetical protein TrRE_jg11511 [Triparma retinervis]|uniref:Uncharacterized protein n=1 Tax=Triparma retinervis TaxID=2557542 RepID=A0A9W7AGS5_9STRA|nr:hypothetical protein TrRE_jg11511 [Triparma retinervis]
MSLVNTSDSLEAGLAVAKLRKINQGLRVGLRDATAGWREAVVLCRDVEKRCDLLYEEVEGLKAQRSAGGEKEAKLMDRIRSMENLGENMKKQIEVAKVEGAEVLRQFEEECRGKEAALRELEDSKEENEKLRARIQVLEKEREQREKSDEREREEREEIDRINKSATEEFLFSTLSDSPDNSGTPASHSPVVGAATTSTTATNNYQPNNIDTVHASIAKSIASRFEESIKERIKQRSMREVKAIEAAVRKALEGLELDGKETKGGKKKKKGAHRRLPKSNTKGAVRGAEDDNVTRLRSRRSRVVNP